MSPIVMLIVVMLVGLFAMLSLLPLFTDGKDSSEAFVHLHD